VFGGNQLSGHEKHGRVFKCVLLRSQFESQLENAMHFHL
jgi:hypothetical protein